jgi:hypothetical protein
MAADDFVTLVVVEFIIILVRPMFGLFFKHGCHALNLTKENWPRQPQKTLRSAALVVRQAVPPKVT